jgi:hypothetical protein
MKRFTVFAALSLLGGSAALAASPQLKGQYAFTGAAHCINSTTGFTANFQALCADTNQPISNQPNPANPRSSCPGVFAHTFSVEGVRTFNGDGTGAMTGRALSIDVPPNTGSLGASSESFTASFTYTVSNDGTVATQLVPGSFQGNVLTGPRAGQTFTIDQIELDGLVSNNRQAVTIASIDPAVETQQFSNGNTRFRICHRSRVLIWMGN